jgi:hypothetical protein
MDEIKELREEIVKLRERIAVLEAKGTQWQYNPVQPSLLERYQNLVAPPPATAANPQFVNHNITHGSGTMC